MRKGGNGIGPRIKSWRKEKGLRLQELSRLLHVSQGSLSDIENENSDPSANTIIEFEAQTDIDILWMLTGKTASINSKREVVLNPENITIRLDKNMNDLVIRIR